MESAWVLGSSYKYEKNTPSQEYKNHAEAFFRFTYRRDFPSLYPYPISSDSGWGCMLRAAQMMMGYGFRKHYLGIDWRLPRNKETLRNSLDYCDILQWFVDYPGYPHIYSIHHLVQCGMKYDKLPGEWFGPSTAALVLRDLARLHRVKYRGPLEVMVTMGDTIYVTEAERICCDTSLSCNANISLIANSKAAGGNSSASSSSNSGSAVRKETPTTITAATTEVASVTATSVVEPADPLTVFATASADPLSISNSIKDDVSKHLKSALSSSSSSAPPRSVPVKGRPVPVPLPSHKVVPATAAGATAGAADPFFDPLLHQPPAAVAPWAHSLMVMLPLRLGIHSVNQEYIEELKEVLRNKDCIGIIGGRPNHAIYFVGYNSADELLGLDPHTTFATPDIHVTAATAITNTNSSGSGSGNGSGGGGSNIFPNAEYLSQIHVNEFVRMPFAQLDPSLAIGFYFQDRPAFQRFCDETRVATAAKLAAGKSPLYAIQHSPPSFMMDSSSSSDEDDDDDDDDEEGEKGGEKSESGEGTATDRTNNKKTKTTTKKKTVTSSKGAARGGGMYDFDEPGGGGTGGVGGDIEDEYVFL